MNIAIPVVVSQLKTPYANIDNTCASSNQCEKDINLNTVLSYPQNVKKEFAIDFTPPTYGGDAATTIRPVRDTLAVTEGFGAAPQLNLDPVSVSRAMHELGVTSQQVNDLKVSAVVMLNYMEQVLRELETNKAVSPDAKNQMKRAKKQLEARVIAVDKAATAEDRQKSAKQLQSMLSNVTENFVNPSGMGPIDPITDDMMQQELALSRIRIEDVPSLVQDDPVQVAVMPPQTISNSPLVFEKRDQTEGFEMMPESEDYSMYMVCGGALLLGAAIYMALRRK